MTRFLFTDPVSQATVDIKAPTWFAGRAIAMAQLGCGTEIQTIPLDLGPFGKRPTHVKKQVRR